MIFSCGYVPTGTFCGLITQLVSLGSTGIFGFEWDLVEDGVKRNCVAFYVDYVNKATLISHDQCYEIRVTHNDPDISLHDSCAHVLSSVLYILKRLYQKLAPQIAFYCPCSQHKGSKDINNLSILVDAQKVHFLCGRRPTTLTDKQQVWLGEVKYFVKYVVLFYDAILSSIACDSW